MKHLIYSTLTICSLSILSGCAMTSLTKEQCASNDWYAIGYNDGVAGHYPDRINKHQEACSELGIIPNFPLWEEGREKGLVHYCTETNAQKLGASGHGLNRVCPANQADKLQRIHSAAYKLYSIRSAIANDKRSLARKEEKLRLLSSGEMLDFKTEAEARSYMLTLQNEIRDLKRRIAENELKLTSQKL